MSHNLCPVSKKGCFWLTGHKWLNANEPSAPCYFPCCSALPPSRPPQKSPSITTMRSRCCYAPPNSKSDATQHSPLDRPCTLHRLPIRCCFEGGYRSPGSPQTLSSSSEHDRFGRSSSPPSMLVPVAHTPNSYAFQRSYDAYSSIIQPFRGPIFTGRDTTQQFANNGDANRR